MLFQTGSIKSSSRLKFRAPRNIRAKSGFDPLVLYCLEDLVMDLKEN